VVSRKDGDIQTAPANLDREDSGPENFVASRKTQQLSDLSALQEKESLIDVEVRTPKRIVPSA
jgi:hypothetical protein